MSVREHVAILQVSREINWTNAAVSMCCLTCWQIMQLLRHVLLDVWQVLLCYWQRKDYQLCQGGCLCWIQIACFCILHLLRDSGSLLGSGGSCLLFVIWHLVKNLKCLVAFSCHNDDSRLFLLHVALTLDIAVRLAVTNLQESSIWQGWSIPSQRVYVGILILAMWNH